MIKNFFIVFFRNFAKNPLYSFLNTFGLAVGFAIFIISILFIFFHLNYNKCHEDYEKIYRVHNGFTMNGKESFQASTLLLTGEKIYNQVPGIENFTRVTTWFSGNSLIQTNDKFFDKVNVFISDTNILEIFSYKTLLGSESDFLKHANQIAITESLSMRIFGGDNPIGKKVTFKNSDFTIGWVIQDPPNNAHLQFDLLVPYDAFNKDWFALDVFTYIKVEDKLTNNMKQSIIDITNQTNKERFSEYGTDFKADVMTLRDIYLFSDFGWEPGRTESYKNLILFGILGLLILIIAIINFVNLLTAKSEERNKEVGLRKVVGAKKAQLQIQFIAESVLLAFISFFLSLIFIEFLVHPINNLLQVELSILKQFSFILLLILFSIPIVTGVFSGYYPAIIMSRFQPISIIKGIFNTSGKPNLLKIILVIFQFSFATLLISIILVFVFQIHYMKNKELGFDAKDVVVFSRITERLQNKYLTLKNDLILNSYISNITASHSVPGWIGSGQFIHFKEANSQLDAISIREYRTQDDFIETFGIKLIAGRTFSYKKYNDTSVFVINQEAARQLGDPNPIGRQVVVSGKVGKIVGMVNDFHYHSLKMKVFPLVLTRSKNDFQNIHNISFKLSENNRAETIDFILTKLKEYDPNYYPTYNFINTYFEWKYADEEKMLEIIIWGSIIAIILSVLGLFALTSFTIHKKYKEIGIRKVQGASVPSIVFLLNKNILRWVLLTNFIAWPIGYWLMDKWLQNFAYRIELNVWYFVIAGAISFVIALGTITFQSRRAALINPVDVIKYE